MRAAEILMDRNATTAADESPRASTIMTVLLHVQDDSSFEDRIETALSLARTCSAHIRCIHVTPFEAYVAFDNFGGVFVMNDVIKALDAEEDQLRGRVEKRLSRENVTWDYRQVTGSVARVIAGQAALADLVVTGRVEHSSQFSGAAIGMIGDLLHWSRTPLLIPGDSGRQFDPTDTAVIAWDGSFQAANAVRSSLGLLKLASDVRVIEVEEDKKKDQPFPGTGLLEFLSRHGIHAELHVEPTRGRSGHDVVTATLLGYAQDSGAAYMVLGAYSHSRIGEYIFGGVTRSLLGGSPLPIVLAR